MIIWLYAFNDKYIKWETERSDDLIKASSLINQLLMLLVKIRSTGPDNLRFLYLIDKIIILKKPFNIMI